jgi:hypothetical protein
MPDLLRHGPLTAVLLLLLAALAVAGCAGSEDDGPEKAAEQPRPMPLTDDSLPGADRNGPLDTGDPSIAHLDPDLLTALQAAVRAARDDGVSMSVTSGWRSRQHQQRLYDEAVATYGSEEEARRYVATPDTSAHVTGDAVDIGPTDADSWLSQHGADYGLCQTFANEMWHFELARTPGGTCPELLPDGSSRG